jgi:hypothetical protein
MHVYIIYQVFINNLSFQLKNSSFTTADYSIEMKFYERVHLDITKWVRFDAQISSRSFYLEFSLFSLVILL